MTVRGASAAVVTSSELQAARDNGPDGTTRGTPKRRSQSPLELREGMVRCLIVLCYLCLDACGKQLLLGLLVSAYDDRKACAGTRCVGNRFFSPRLARALYGSTLNFRLGSRCVTELYLGQRATSHFRKIPALPGAGGFLNRLAVVHLHRLVELLPTARPPSRPSTGQLHSLPPSPPLQILVRQRQTR